MNKTINHILDMDTPTQIHSCIKLSFTLLRVVLLTDNGETYAKLTFKQHKGYNA